MRDYRVHPVAAMFPLLSEDSQEFADLAGSILENGVLHKLVVDGEVLLDGRNRLAVCRKLNIEPPMIEWSEMGVRSDVSQAEWILEINLKRRHLKDDQRVMIVTEFNRWWLEQEARAAQKGGKPLNFTEGHEGHEGETAKRRPITAPGTDLSLKTGTGGKRDHKSKHDHSTAGKIAKLAGTTRHKAAQAVEVSKAAERGVISAETVAAVKSGALPLKAAAQQVAAARPRPRLAPTLESRIERIWRVIEKEFKDEELGPLLLNLASRVNDFTKGRKGREVGGFS